MRLKFVALAPAGIGALAAVAFGFCSLTAQAQEIIEVHNTMSAGGAEDETIQRFKEIVEERSDGRFEVHAYMGGQLGDEIEVLELLNVGQTQISLNGGIFLLHYAGEYDAVTVPFIFPNWKSVEHYIMETSSGEAMQQLSRERGNLVYLGPQMRAFRHMTSSREINTPDDLEGLKMRLPQNPLWMDVWEELGVQAVAIPAPDIYLAMRTGQVEAHENSLASPYTRQMWEVQDYIITTSHLSFPWHWVASASWWDGLDVADQEMLREAVEEARQYGYEVEQEKDDFYREGLIEKGMTFIEVDQALFREKAAPALERALANKAEGVMEDIEAAIAASESN